MSNIFRFKKFSVNQDKTAMKIGTDGVLLGAWTDLSHHPQSILDIGSGTGVIGLMMAQRSSAETIDAIELEDSAYIQTVENFENSPWSDRLFCYHIGFNEFAQEMDEKYDLIISNPPFFEKPQKEYVLSEKRQKARFTHALSFKQLVHGVSKLLSRQGKLSVIIPYSEEEGFIQIAENANLFPQKRTHVKGHQNAPTKRSLIQFGFEQKQPTTNMLIIEHERHEYTNEYVALTKNFYLKM